MTGIFLLAVAGFWIWASAQLTRLLLRQVRSRTWQRVIAPAVFVVLLLFPVADELVARPQFNALCEKNAVLNIDAAKAKGRSVRLVFEPSNELVPGQVLTTYHSHVSMRDVGSDEEIAGFSRYSVKGGWLIRMLAIFETNAPLTMRSSCAPDLGAHGMAKAYNFTIVN